MRPSRSIRTPLALAALTLALLLAGCAIRIGTVPLISAEGVPLAPSVCREGGWQELRDDRGEPFKNQGDCVSFVQSSGRR